MLLLLACTGSKPDSASPDSDPHDSATSGPVGPDIEVSPSSLDFGEVAAGTTSTLTITITDPGDADLELYGMLVEQKEFPFTVSDTDGAVIPPGTSFDLDVTYAPTDTSAASSHVRIYSNDGETPVLLVAIFGQGV